MGDVLAVAAGATGTVVTMRLGVLDVGSNTVHLVAVDASLGMRPVTRTVYKTALRLSELLEPDGSVSEHGTERLMHTLVEAREEAEGQAVDELLAFATSAIRDAPNAASVLARARDEAGVDLEVLAGAEEARLTFLAVRRWFGWSAGPLLVVDIGGGSLELGAGEHELPDVAVSVPLGANRLQVSWLSEWDPPGEDQIEALRVHIRKELAPVAAEIRSAGSFSRGQGTSKTFRSLARLASGSQGRLTESTSRLEREALRKVVARVAPMTAVERAELPGVSVYRANQLLAGAVLAEEVMDALGVGLLKVCPWALREGIVMRRLDWLSGL